MKDSKEGDQRKNPERDKRGKGRRELAPLPSVIETEEGRIPAAAGESGNAPWQLQAAVSLGERLSDYYSYQREEWDIFSREAGCKIVSECGKVNKVLKKSGQSVDSLYNSK